MTVKLYPTSKKPLPAVGFDLEAKRCLGVTDVTTQTCVLRHESVTVVHRRLKVSDELVQHQACGIKNKMMMKNPACEGCARNRNQNASRKTTTVVLLVLLRIHVEG
jgi:hypothetical protein